MVTRLSARLLVIPALAAALGLAACQNGQQPDKQDFGTVLGGIGGAVLGAQFGKSTGQLVCVAAGALAGAYLGNQIGASLDTADNAAMEQASHKATTAPVGQSIPWRTPDKSEEHTTELQSI